MSRRDRIRDEGGRFKDRGFDEKMGMIRVSDQLKSAVQQYADMYEISFAEATRHLIREGIANSGLQELHPPE